MEDWENEEWESIKEESKYGNINDTGVDLNSLKEIGMKISILPKEE